jgi:hypothetical protein
MVVVIDKEDFGTEQRAIDATLRVEKHADDNFRNSIIGWWGGVLDTAKQLCIEMGAIDTWTLYNTIRIVREAPAGVFYEVTVSSDVIVIDRMIVAGGWLVNPKTGNICDYAESVHDGTGMNWKKGPRPFLSLALDMHEPELMRIMNKFMGGQGKEWERN